MTSTHLLRKHYHTVLSAAKWARCVFAVWDVCLQVWNSAAEFYIGLFLQTERSWSSSSRQAAVQVLSSSFLSEYFTTKSLYFLTHIRNKLEEVSVPNSWRIHACRLFQLLPVFIYSGAAYHLTLWTCQLNTSSRNSKDVQKDCTFLVVKWSGFTLNCILCLVVRICSSDFFWIPENFFRFTNVSLIIYTIIVSVLMQSLHSYKLCDITIIMQFGGCGSCKHHNNMI